MTDPSVFKEKTVRWIGLNKKTLDKLPKGENQIDGNLLGSIRVYEDNNLEDDKVLVGYRGQEFLDAGLIYAPHLGLGGRPPKEYYTEVLLDAGITMIGECDE